jgi:hypothetical protein
MTDTPMATILNCTTGEVIERPLTAEEIEAQEIAKIRRLEFEAQMQAEAEAKAELKSSALAKLSNLGLTQEELQAIIG